MQRLFCTSVSYPNEKKALYERLLGESTHPPLKNAYNYFYSYIQKNGTREHPILGDLLLFVEEVENNWDSVKSGVNLITGLLRSKLDFNPIETSSPS